MPALLILEIHENMLFSPFEKFMSPIYELLIESNFREVSTSPAIGAKTNNRVNIKDMVFYSEQRVVNPQMLRDLAKKIKSMRGRPRFIKNIKISYQLMDV